MQTHLKTIELRTGEQMDVVRVTCPDEELREKILPFLAHKGPDWQIPMEQNLAAPLEGLGQHFYVGMVDGQIVGNASSVEGLDRPVGILQHVYTLPERRRQGICSTIIHAYAADFDARGGRAAYLHTGYDSTAYHIYASVGFVGYLDTGIMERLADPDFHRNYWAPRPVSVRDTRWQDWAPLEALYGIVDGWYLRSMYFGQWGRSGYEGDYVRLRKQMAEGRVQQVKVLVADNGAVVGHAFMVRDRVFRGDTWVLDFFLHPNYYDQAAVLLDSIDLALDAKVQCLVDASQPERADMLEKLGLSLQATLTAQVRRGEDWLDISVYA